MHNQATLRDLVHYNNIHFTSNDVWNGGKKIQFVLLLSRYTSFFLSWRRFASICINDLVPCEHMKNAKSIENIICEYVVSA